MGKDTVLMLKKCILAGLLLLSLLAGCGGPRPSPEEVIARAIDAIDELQTYRFEMTGTMTMEGKTSHDSMQGEFVSPDRLHVTTTSNEETEEGIRIGQTQYQLSHNGEWEMHEWSAALSFVSINWAATVAELLDTLVELVELGDEKIDGVSCFHYRGNIDIEAQLEEQIANLDSTLPGYEEQLRLYEQLIQSEHHVEFWVGKGDYLLRRLDTQHDVTYTEYWGEDTENEKHINSTYSLRFFDFNEPIQIDPPVID
jgi:hypothetical protein